MAGELIDLFRILIPEKIVVFLQYMIVGLLLKNGI